MTLIFNKLLQAVMVHVPAKLDQAKCSSSRVFMLTRKTKNHSCH